MQAQQNRKQGLIFRKDKWDSFAADTLNRSFFTVGTDFGSRVLFCGRDFGERQYGVSPYLVLNSAGFYMYAQMDWWSDADRSPARHVTGMGYDAQLSENLALFAGYERWFNHYNDDYFDNALKNEVEAGARYRAGKFLLEPTFYFFFGWERIYELDIMVSRPLILVNKKVKVSLTPGILATFATPVFAYMFYEFPDPEYDYEKFRIVDYESGLSLLVLWKNFELSGSANYNMPIRLSNEIISPFYYFTCEVSYSF